MIPAFLKHIAFWVAAEDSALIIPVILKEIINKEN